MIGNFWGGVTSGALSTWRQMREDEDAAINNRMKQRHLDQLDKQDALNAQLGQIQAQQNAADEAARLIESYGGPQTNIDASIEAAKQNGETLTPVQEEGIRKAWAVKSDPIRRYEFNVQRANAHAATGDWRTANAIKKEAESDAAGEWVGAILGGDRKTVADLYNLYPNGHAVAGVDFDDKGNLLVTEKDGRQRTVTQYDAITTAMSLMDPKTAADMVASKFKTDQQMERFRQMLEGRDKDRELKDQAIKQRLDELTLRLAAGRGGQGGSGSGGAHGGGGMPSEVADVYHHYGYKDPSEFTSDIRKRVAADRADGGLSGVDLQALATKTQSATAALMAGQLGRGYNVEELYPIAYKMAQAELGVRPLGPDGKPQQDDPKQAMAFKPYPEFGADGKWYAEVRDSAGNAFRLGNRPVSDPTSLGLSPEKVADIEISYPAYGSIFKQAAADAARGDHSSFEQIVQQLGRAKADALMAAYQRQQSAGSAQASSNNTAELQPTRLANANDRGQAPRPLLFTSEELTEAAEFGIKPKSSLGEYINRAKEWGVGLVDSARRNAFGNYLLKFRTTHGLDQGDALYLFTELQANPSWRSQLSPKELTAVQVAAGKKFNN